MVIGWSGGDWLGDFLALLYWTAGCKHPVQIVTNNRVTMDTPNLRHATPGHDSRHARRYPGVGRQIALIDVDGLLVNQPMTGLYSDGENPVALFREKLDRVASSALLRGLVLRINSPGGGVTASDVMWHDLQEFKAHTHLPVIACLMDVGPAARITWLPPRIRSWPIPRRLRAGLA